MKRQRTRSGEAGDYDLAARCRIAGAALRLMSATTTTSWGLIERARRGEAAARADFVGRYERLVRDFLGARWAKSPLRADLDDAVQEYSSWRLAASRPRQRVEQTGERGTLKPAMR